MEKNEPEISRAVRMVAELTIDKASLILSKILKTGARIELKKISMVDISEATESVNAASFDAIGAYIDLVGDAPFKFLFLVAQKDALLLTDLILRKPAGTTQQMNLYVESSVQEIGNILASAVSNVFSTDFQLAMKPSPPIVLSDFSGVLFSEMIVEEASSSDRILLIESTFEVVRHKLDCFMYILPKAGSEKVLGFVAGASPT